MQETQVTRRSHHHKRFLCRRYRQLRLDRLHLLSPFFQTPDHDFQFLRIHRFQQKIEGISTEGVNHIFVIGCIEHDLHVHSQFLPGTGNQFHAQHIGQFHILKHQVRAYLFDQFQPCRSIVCHPFHYNLSVWLQGQTEIVDGTLFVIYNYCSINLIHSVIWLIGKNNAKEW